MAGNYQGANAGTGREGTFGQILQKFVSSRLPYQAFNSLDVLNNLNPKWSEFQKTGSKRTEALSKQSISSSTLINDTDIGKIVGDHKFQNYMYSNISSDKGARIRDYRVMAAFAEVGDALDEICDEFINKDEDGEIIKIVFKTPDIKPSHKEEFQQAFKQYINNFDLEHKGWEYCRQLLIDGEIYFEHIIHSKHLEEGILGVVVIPNELIDPIYGNIQNLMIKGFLLRKPVFNLTNPNKIEKYEFIPLDKNQVTYISSGLWNENKTFRLPFLENARRAYRQLSLCEDNIIIYRLVRSPERLVFNVDVGNMPTPKAEGYLRRLMEDYWSRKTFDNDQGATVQQLNPQGSLDSFWFAKRSGSEGTKVEKLESNINLGELTDLQYFIKKLYRSLKIPVNRVNPDSEYKDGLDILREELKFARFIMRVQMHFSEGLKNGFITHLKFKKLWDKFDIQENEFDLEFNPPSNFMAAREQQKISLKAESFNNLTSNESISKMYAQKKYLGWSDKEILANIAFLKKDAENQWEVAQIQSSGPNWREQAATGAPGANAGGSAAGGGGTSSGGGGESTPPAFGPTPPATGGEETGEQPEGGNTPQENAPTGGKNNK